MSSIQKTVKSYLRAIWNTVRWLVKAPFQNLPPNLKDVVPPELQVFKAQADEIQHHAVEEVSSSQSHGHKRSKPRR